jgi:hypothetical protein
MWPLTVTAIALLALAALVFGGPTGASQPYQPTFDLVSISNSATGANADITFRTDLPAGNHIIGFYGLSAPSWGIAGYSQQLKDKVAVVGTLAINLDTDGNCHDGDSGAPQSYGPFPLLYIDAGPGAPHATWSGLITDFGDGNPGTYWGLTFIVEPSSNGFTYTISAGVTDAILPAGNVVCTPQALSLTFCGRANPTPTATTCGSGSNPVVMTNPSSAACYAWRLTTHDETSEHTAILNRGVSIGGTPCPTATPTASPTATPPAGDSDGDGVPDSSDNCPTWWNPSQDLPPWQVPPNDPDCDGFTAAVEDPAGTNPLVQCGTNAWPADMNNDTFSDISDISSLGGSFGKPVPPAPARHNIAPDPALDGFVDIIDISKIGGFFGRTCAPCPADLDCDTIGDAVDNCPSWPNLNQQLPPWPVPPNDPDCDGFSTAVENSAGTGPQAHCGANAWPADLNNDGSSDITDISVLGGSFGESVPPAPARHNIAPDPVDTVVDITDISRIGGFFGKTCS